MINKKLMVLAGGFGTRLRQVVSDVPKPLAPVAGNPFIFYLLQRWHAEGVRDFVFLLHYEVNKFEDYLHQMKDVVIPSSNIELVVEKYPLGTGGAVAFAISELSLEESFLLANADTYLESGLADLSLSEAPCLGCVYVPDASRYGKVEISDGRVVAFKEKQKDSGGGWINAGISHLTPEYFKDWGGEPFSIEQKVFPKMVSERNLKAMKLETNFVDIGIPEDYFRFCDYVESKGQKVL